MMRAIMRLGVVAAVALAFAGVETVVHADLLMRAVGDATGGGSVPSTAVADDFANDLSTWAGTAKPITLPELLQFTVRQAPALLNAKLDIAVAEAQIYATYARHDWRIQAQFAGTKTTSYFSGIAISTDQYGITGDLIRVLPTGATVDIHASSQYNNNSAQLFGSSIYWLDNVSGSITQPLLKGRGEWLYDATERKAKLSRDASVLARRLAAINAVQAVVSGYWDLVLAERQVEITEASLTLAHEQLRVTQIGAKGGKVAEAEIPAVEQTIATREEDVLNGELAVLNAGIVLRRGAGMPIGAGELGLHVSTDYDIRERNWELGPLVEAAYTASPELAQLEKQDKSATIDIEVNDNGLLPQLDAALSFGPIGEEAGFGATARDLAEFKTLSIGGTLTYSRALGQEDVKGQSRALRAGREKLRVNAVDIRAQIAQTMARSVAQIELAKRRVVLSDRAITLANENIRIETDRFNLGRATNFDVLMRLEELRQAQLRKAQALVDYHKAETMVMALTGEILPAFGITID